MRGSADLAEADLGALRNGCDVLDLDRRAIAGFDDGVFDVLHAVVKAYRLNIDLLRALFDKAAAAIGVVVGDLLFNLTDGETVSDKLIGIETNLVLLGRTAEAGYIDYTWDTFEGLLQGPVFKRFFLHHIVGGVVALDGVPEDLSNGTPICTHLRSKVRRQTDLA